MAETTVEGTFDNAGNEGFHRLAGYIFGGNSAGAKIPMTAPVTQQYAGNNNYNIQFMMPHEYDLATLPSPNDSRVHLKEVPTRNLAAIKYHGGWSEHLYSEHLSELQHDIKGRHKSVGEPIWARYNSPMAPSPLRTNEILQEIMFD